MRRGAILATIPLAALCISHSASAETGGYDPINALARVHEFSAHASHSPQLPQLPQFDVREIAMRAMSLIGVRYKFGGEHPEHGMDCSGLVRYVFRESWGAQLPRTSREISRVGAKINADELQPGDLVFFNTLRQAFSHVGIYLGDNKFIHAPNRGASVRVERMDRAYWQSRFNGARRMTQPEM